MKSQLILKYEWKSKGSRIAKEILKRKVKLKASFCVTSRITIKVDESRHLSIGNRDQWTGRESWK